MYILNETQIESMESFISKIPESMIKSKIEDCFAKMLERPNMVTPETMQDFVSCATHLPQELQDFPKGFEMGVKNQEILESDDSETKKEKSEKSKSKTKVESKTKKKK